MVMVKWRNRYNYLKKTTIIWIRYSEEKTETIFYTDNLSGSYCRGAMEDIKVHLVFDS